MPMLLSTPERWFRTKKSDFYELRPKNERTKLPKELTDWLSKNLQNPQLHFLGPSEHSGWICGGGSMAVVAMGGRHPLQ